MNITSKYRSLSIQARAAAVANVVLNFIFIRIFGYVAAGYTTLACYILYSVGHYVVSKRILVAEGIEVKEHAVQQFDQYFWDPVKELQL